MVSPDVETLWRRYEGYLEGKEPISSMANFCLTLVKQRGSGRKGAAKLLGIAFDVLRKLDELAATKGDEKTARKVPRGGFTSYTPPGSQMDGGSRARHHSPTWGTPGGA